MKKLSLIFLSVAMLSVASFSSAATEEFRSLGGFNTVLIYTPDTLSPRGGRSLMIVLHGCTQKPVDFRNANLQVSADKNGTVIAVPDAMHKEGLDCWDFWTTAPDRNSKDYKNLISLVDAMVKESKYLIDRNQVYIVGFSSGGVFAMNIGCLAPDVFAGIGLVGAASAGTAGTGIVDTPQVVRQKCETFAGINKAHFQTQITVSSYGTLDYTVNQRYGPVNASAMALVYGHSDVSINADIPKAKIKVNTEQTVSLVQMTNEAHKWPGGVGASGSTVGVASINIATYLGEFFNANNRRVTAPDPAPEQPIGLQVEEMTYTTATLSITDPSNPKVVKYRVSVLNTGDVLGELTAQIVGGRAILKLTGLEPNTHYQVEVVAIDNSDQESIASAPISFTLPSLPPVKYTVTAQVIGQGGEVAPASQQVDSGSNATVIITPHNDYLIDTVTGCPGSLSGNTYTTSAVTENCTIFAQFKAVVPEPEPVPNPGKSSSGGAIPLCLLFFMPVLLAIKQRR